MNCKLKATTLTLALISSVCFQQVVLAYDQSVFPGKGSKEDFAKAAALSDKGSDFQDQANYKDALGMFQKAVSAYPYAAVFHYNVGQAYAKLNDYKSAIPGYKTAVKLAPDFQIAYANLSNAQFKIGKLREAERTALKASELDPNDPIAWINLAQAEIPMKKTNSAKEHLLKAKNLPNAKEFAKDIAELDQKLGN